MTKLSIETCVTALNRAALNRKAAFQIELAAGLAVFLVAGGTGKDAKANLCSAYAGAGYACLTTTDIDYKTVNRRINVSADLFNTLSADKVAKWAGKHNEAVLLDSIVLGLQPYELFGVRDVERLCAPPEPTTTQPTVKVVVPPATDILAGPADGQRKVVDMFKRAAMEVAKGANHIETEHLAIMVPDAATSDELIQIAMSLLSLAQERKELLTA